MLAGWTCTTRSEPSVSVTRWRLRPFIFLAGSNPRGPPSSVVLTDWLSMTPAEGLGSRPAASRFQQQLEIDPLQHAAVAPSVEIMLHRRIRRELAGQRRHWQPVRTI